MADFRLKTVLDYRRQVEDICQKDFAQSKREWQRQRDILQQGYDHWKESMDRWRKMQQNRLTVWEMDMYQKYMLYLRRELSEQAQRVKKSLDTMDKKRSRLLNAQKEKKKLETLEENHLKNYIRFLSEQEKKFVDDIAMQRFNERGPLK
jgi:flagellar FliJ protein